MPERSTRSFAASVALACAACGTGLPARQPGTPEPFPAAHLAAVLVAGDAAQPVFDRAMEHLRKELVLAGVPARSISRLSALPSAPGVEPATRAATVERIGALNPGPRGVCFVYLTSHGKSGLGLSLSRAGEWLDPLALDSALSRGCAKVPTVVVVSACFSGQFVVPALQRDNRIVLTASRADRASFGCAPGVTFANFDACFFGALQGAPTWQDVFARARACVQLDEQRAGLTPSEPQAFFGSAVAALATPWGR